MTNSINSRDIKRLLFSHGAYNLSRRMLGIFISIYIWDLTGSMYDIALFHIVFFLSHSLSFSLFAKAVKNGTSNSIKAIGLAGLTGFYIALFLLKEQTVQFLIPLAIIWGLFNGMYWISYHVQSFDITHTKNRGNFVGTERTIRTLISLVAPILGGFLIVTDLTTLGFGNVLIFGILLQGISLITGVIHKKVLTSKKVHLFRSFKLIMSKKDQRRLLYSGMSGNIGYIRALKHVIVIYLFIFLGNELEVGSWISFFAILSMAATLFAGKYLQYKHYLTIAFAGSTLLAMSIGALAFFPSLIAYIILGSVRQFFDPLIGLGRRVYQYNLLHELPNVDAHRVELVIIREWFQVGVGGTISFIPLLFVANPTPQILMPILLFMAVATFISGLLIKSVKTDISKL